MARYSHKGHETPFVDVADSIYRDMLVTTFLRVVRNIDFCLSSNYCDKGMPRYDLNITIFDMIRYIVPSLATFVNIYRAYEPYDRGRLARISIHSTLSFQKMLVQNTIVDHESLICRSRILK